MIEKTSRQTMRVAIVDDEEPIRAALRVVLEAEGFEVSEASDLVSGRALVKDTKFDVLLADKNLPDGSGLELGKLVRDEQVNAEAILITAYASLDSAVEAFENRFIDYVIKPFDITEIVSRVQRAAQTVQLRRHNRELLEELKEKNAVLERLATRDVLTGLLTHAHFKDRLDAEIDRQRREEGSLAVALVGLDGFAEYNRVHGRAAGDAVLRTISALLGREGCGSFSLRSSDFAGRYAGDQFGIVFDSLSSREAADRCESLRRCLASGALEVEGRTGPTVSIGVAGFPADGVKSDAMLAAAAKALRVAKQAGSNRLVAYVPALRNARFSGTLNAVRLAQGVLELEATLAEEKFEVHFQPLVHARTHKLYGYEALVRPDRAHYSNPGELIGAAECAGRVPDLGDTIRAVALRSWDQLGKNLVMSLNLHPLDLRPRLVEWGAALQIDRSRIVLEITESAEIGSYSEVTAVLADLRGLGFKIAVDDLGAGYAALNSLVRLKPDVVKLDMALVRGVHENMTNKRLVEHVLQFAAGEGMSVVAEGVETREQLQSVEELGCDIIQGWLFGKAQPPFAQPLQLDAES